MIRSRSRSNDWAELSEAPPHNAQWSLRLTNCLSTTPKTKKNSTVTRSQCVTERGIHGQISGDEGENAICIARRDRAGDHPNLTATRIKVRGRPDTRVRCQWRRAPDLSLNVIGGRGEVVGGVAVGGAIDVGTGDDRT